MLKNKLPYQKSIKSAGLINGEYKIILEDDTEIFGIQHLEVYKDLGGLGRLTLTALLLENNNK